MFDMLSDLYDGTPSVRSELLFAVITLHVELSELSNKGLLDFGIVVELLFDGDFDFDSFGVALSPNEASIDDFGFVESFDFF